MQVQCSRARSLRLPLLWINPRIAAARHAANATRSMFFSAQNASRLFRSVAAIALLGLACGLCQQCVAQSPGGQSPEDQPPGGQPPAVQSSRPAAQLTIGSPAPPLNIEHWIHDGDGRFKHVTNFEKGKVYLVEFWATWCTPCVEAMPHVVALQKQHAEHGFQVVAISNESLDTIDAFLDQSVPDSEDEKETYRKLTSAYCLVSDPDGSSGNDYMLASKQRGIPCSFLVGKSGLIEWIGHPMAVDEPVQKVIDDSWDRAAFLKEYQEEQRADELMEQLQSLVQQGQTDAALQQIDEAIKSSGQSALKDRYRVVKFQILASSPSMADKLAAYIKSTLDDDQLDPQLANMIGWNVYQLHKARRLNDATVLQAAITRVSKAAQRAGENEANVWDTVAHLQQISGDLEAALKSQTKAVELALPTEKESLAEFLEELQAAQKGK